MWIMGGGGEDAYPRNVFNLQFCLNPSLKAAIMQTHDSTTFFFEYMSKFWTKKCKTGKPGSNFMYLPRFDKYFQFHMFLCQ
jgi:hypothetical protein